MASFGDLYHWLYPFFGGLWYRFPGRQLTVIGVTGTDGKSSTVVMLARILNAAGHRTGHFASVSYGDGSSVKINDKKMTTPGRFYLQRFLRKLVSKGCTHVVLEVTSEGIKQYRHSFIGFDRVVFTNITTEHIERHGGFEKYRNTKLSLLKSLRGSSPLMVANMDDPVLMDFLNSTKQEAIRVSMSEKSADVYGTVTESDMEHTVLKTRIGEKEEVVSLNMGGPFAAKNALMAIAAAVSMGVPLKDATGALSGMDSVFGRFEVIGRHPFVIVDYGHTIAALEILLPYVRSHAKKKLLHVFGAAGGGRDHWKRKQLAELSEKYADVSILTEENPFDENPEEIIKDIRAGFKDQSRVRVVPGREAAVLHALSEAKPDDIVLLTAKGSETVIAGPKGSRRPYNERAYVSELLSKPVAVSGRDPVPSA